MVKVFDKKKLRLKRAVRQTQIVGTPERPRVVVFRSNKNISAQIVDDANQVTLVSSSTNQLGLKGLTVENAAKVGEDLGKKALEKNISKVVFDRNGYVYHGRVKALAEALREAGLQF